MRGQIPPQIPNQQGNNPMLGQQGFMPGNNPMDLLQMQQMQQMQQMFMANNPNLPR